MFGRDAEAFFKEIDKNNDGDMQRNEWDDYVDTLVRAMLLIAAHLYTAADCFLLLVRLCGLCGLRGLRGCCGG